MKWYDNNININVKMIIMMYWSNIIMIMKWNNDINDVINEEIINNNDNEMKLIIIIVMW